MAFSSLDELITDPVEVIVTNCNQDQIAHMVSHRMAGWSYQRIANKYGFHLHQTRRYLRLFDLYGIEAFKPDQGAAA